MEKIGTGLKDCYVLENIRFGDQRGYFESVTKSAPKRVWKNIIQLMM